MRQLVFPTPWGEAPASLLGLALMLSVLAGRHLLRRELDDLRYLALVLAGLVGGAFGGAAVLGSAFELLPVGVVLGFAVAWRLLIAPPDRSRQDRSPQVLDRLALRAGALGALLVAVASFLERPSALGFLLEGAGALGLIVLAEQRRLALPRAVGVYLWVRAASLALRPDHPHVVLELALDLGVGLSLVLVSRRM